MTVEAAATAPAPNHHAGHPGFSGVVGLAVGLVLAARGGARARAAVEQAGVTRGDHVVDVGCGPGTAVRAAARRGATVTGVDPAPVMLALARRLTRRGGPITWADGVAERLPVGDGAATVVWSLATVHHWSDLEGGLAEARRVLAPGGRFLAIERRTRPGARGLASHGWTDAQADAFADLCRGTGFVDVLVRRRAAGRRSMLVVRCRKA
jgi:SAM-dependent methyltransferase